MDNLNIVFTYTFHSGLGPMEGDRYVREIHVEIINTDDSGEKVETVGRAKYKLIYLDEAINNEYNIVEVLDSYEYLMRHAQDFFDFENLEFSNAVQKHYNHEIHSCNICLIERVEILPKFRGLNLGAKVIKDSIFHFSMGGTIFIVQPYPLQFEIKNGERTEWENKLQLEKFNSDESKAFKQLSSYYQNMGFEKIKGIKDLLFYNPLFKNKKLEAIYLEE